jgi:Sulfatase
MGVKVPLCVVPLLVSTTPQTRFAMKLLALFALVFSAALSAAEPRPNVLFIMADDLRDYGGVFTRDLVKTPNLDRPAHEGTDFQQFNTASPVCSPSRTAFMTGRFPARVSIH